MNFKSRIKAIERKLNLNDNGFEFKRLLDPGFVYKGKPFNDPEEMYEKLNIFEIPPYFTDETKMLLIQKGLLSHTSREAEDLRMKAIKEMERLM